MRRLIEFLANAGYPHPISQKILSAPSAKDFQNIFRFLYAQLDPGYDFGKKFEEEVPILMKGLRYPFAGDISKSQLYAVGSMHAWPGLLAMLGWMVDLVGCCDLLTATESSEMHHDQTNDEDEAMEDGEKVDCATAETIFFDYLCRAYRLFLAGSDDLGPLVQDLKTRFGRQGEAILVEIDDLKSRLQNQEAEITLITGSESPLARATKEHCVYASDIEKFEKFITHLREKLQRLNDAIEGNVNALADVENAISALETERSTLQAQVDAQHVNPEDIDRMNAEKEQLTRAIDSLAAAREEAQRVFWEREMLVQKRLDSTERLVMEFNWAGEALSLIPAEAANNLDQIDISLSFNPSAANFCFLNTDLKTIVLPVLEKLRLKCHDDIHQSQTIAADLSESLDQVGEAASDGKEAVGNAERRLERLVSAYLEAKETALTENSRTDQEAEALETAISRLRSEANTIALQSQQRLQRISLEQEQLKASTYAEKERVSREVIRFLEELMSLKSSIESTLADLETGFDREG